ncbi:STE3-type pheromone receptor [Ceratobasidium sp. AG-Ba]|nr:STE3-type pheromone receptor [Ceratobasidium sp. AG-Ba]
MKEVSTLQDTRRKDIFIDLLLGIMTPALVVILYYVVQNQRYLIMEDVNRSHY